MITLFEGRIGRKNYWIGIVICISLLLLLPKSFNLSDSIPFPAWVSGVIISIFLSAPFVVICAKRFRDFDVSGYWALIIFTSGILINLPAEILESKVILNLLNYIETTILIVLGLKRSNPENAPNGYGDSDSGRSFLNSLLNK